MPPKVQKKVVFPIESPDQFRDLANPELNKKLSVIEMHLDWCGNATCMDQNYRSLYFSFDMPEQRIDFWTCAEGNIPEEIMANLKNGPLTCKPRFLILAEGEIKEEVDGADYTKIVQASNKYIPQLDD
uniref:Thioredoxin domain-containing protein n=1 Tax=Strombidinopsis acuminata TaxID=141414 RepID=A0A7S3TXA8_9SPIT|mmetsp:Transcript_80666/g.111725  ORF Transcript_80666/g.111725 Transcript_80666/m.111725 type:complete len:128 (+) Transcript_80666:27-410(+)